MEVNAVIQSRDLTLYQQTYAEGETFPDDTIAPGGTISGYTARKATDGGIGFSTEQNNTPVYIDQRPDRLYTISGARTVQFKGQLAELLPANMLIAAGMGDVDTLAPSATAYGHEDFIVGPPGDPQYNNVILDVPQPINRLPFRIFGPLVQSEGSLNFTISPTQKGIANYVGTALLDETQDEDDFPGGVLFIARRVTPMSA